MTSEGDLGVALHAVAGTTDTPPPPVADLIRRGRRSRRTRNLTRSVAVIGVLAAAGGTTAVTASATRPEPAQPAPVSAAPVDVASAAEATGETSFRFALTGDSPGRPGRACHGALDRRAEVGWEKGTGTDRFEIRHVGGTQYVKEVGKAWRAEPSSAFTQSLTCTGLTNGDVGPASVVRSLKEKGEVTYTGRTGTGEDAVDNYTFSYSIKDGLLRYSGVIEAGVSSRLIQKVTATLKGDGINSTFTSVYSGFGEPVQVTAPDMR